MAGKKKVKTQTKGKQLSRGEAPRDNTTFVPVRPDGIEKGDLVAFTYWAYVKANQPGLRRSRDRHLEVTDIDHGTDFSVRGEELIESSRSADFVGEEIVTTQTEVIERFMRLYNVPFTVCFDKQDGTERIIRGRMIEPDGLRGRSKVEELIDSKGDVVPRGKRFKQVDHRTIKWVIANGIKWIAR